jgi:chromosome partitioning protein
MITLIAGQKGGTGKSTLSTNIAAEFARLGKDVILVDADHQVTATEWWAERKLTPLLPQITCVQSYGEIDSTLLDLNKRYEHVIVDCAGKASSEMSSAMLCADILITPVRPSQADLNTLGVLCDILKQSLRINSKMSSYIVLTMASNNPQITETIDAKTFTLDYPLLKPLNQVIYDRKVYRDCLSAGYGVTEFSNDKATNEIKNLISEIYNGI